MPIITVSEFSLIPAGAHLLKLESVEAVKGKDFNDPSKEVTRWKWEFLAKMTDENGVNYTAVEYTNTKYGDSRASLTKLLNMIDPGMNEEKAQGLNTDVYVGKFFNATINHENNNGKIRAHIAALMPYVKGQPTPVAKPVDKDPFADE